MLATFDFQRRFDTGQGTQLSCSLGDVPLMPLSLPILEGDRAIGMIEAHNEMLLLLPNRAPHRHIIKATVQQPGHRLVLFEPTQGLAHRRQRLLHFFWPDFQNPGPGC